MRYTFSRLMVLGLLVGVVSSLPAAEKKMAEGMDMNAMMAQMQKFGTPGAEHQALQPLVGKFTATVRNWMKPGDKPTESTGTSDSAWVLSGRFLRQEFKGQFGGQPFEGLGFTGFDKVRSEYQSIWLDSMGTGIMKVAGTFDAASKTIKQSGTMSCPLTGEKAMPYRSELKIDGPNQHTYTSYSQGPDGKEFKGMEIVYKRVQ
jgi:hypothetical protein